MTMISGTPQSTMKSQTKPGKSSPGSQDMVDREFHEETVAYYERQLQEQFRENSKAHSPQSLLQTPSKYNNNSQVKNQELLLEYEEQMDELKRSNRELQVSLKKARRELSRVQEQQLVEPAKESPLSARSRSDSVNSNTSDLSGAEFESSIIVNDRDDRIAETVVVELKSNNTILQKEVVRLTEVVQAMELELQNRQLEFEQLQQLYDALRQDHEKLRQDHEDVVRNHSMDSSAGHHNKSLFEELNASTIRMVTEDDHRGIGDTDVEEVSEHSKILDALNNKSQVLQTAVAESELKELQLLLEQKIMPYLHEQESKKKSYKTKCKFLVGEVDTLRDKVRVQGDAIKSAEDFLQNLTMNIDQMDITDLSVLMEVLSGGGDKSPRTIGSVTLESKKAHVEVCTASIQTEQDISFAASATGAEETVYKNSPTKIIMRTPSKRHKPKLVAKKQQPIILQTSITQFSYLQIIIISLMFAFVAILSVRYYDFISAPEPFTMDQYLMRAADLIDMYDAADIPALI